jgi:hypothetical protein
MERDVSSSEAAATLARTSMPVSRRITFVRWVRRMHGWFGLWGAILGLLAGTSGIWLNHRAVLKLPLSQQLSNAQLELPEPRPATIDAMAAWLKQALHLDREPNNTKVERARPVPWMEKGGEAKPLMQPERWMLTFGGPNRVVQVEYWVGNRSVSVRTVESGFIATLTNLHKGVSMSVAWILLIDTLAGSLIFLSLSGVILWWETNRRRLVGLTIFGVSVAATVAIATSQLQW